jgi:hypothetical protein
MSTRDITQDQEIQKCAFCHQSDIDAVLRPNRFTAGCFTERIPLLENKIKTTKRYAVCCTIIGSRKETSF